MVINPTPTEINKDMCDSLWLPQFRESLGRPERQSKDSDKSRKR